METHPLVRTGATHVLQSLPVITRTVNVEPDETSFENLAAHTDAELALIDLPLPDIGNLPTLSRLLQQPHPRHVTVFGEADPAAHVRTLMQLNVSVYLLKGYSGKLIAAALKLVLAGGHYIPASIVPIRSEANVAGSSNGNGDDDCALLGLTQRQYGILALFLRGYLVKTISRMLNTSEATAKAHINTLYRRLEVRSRIEAVFIATQHGVMLLNQPNIRAETASSSARSLCLARTG